MQRRLDNRNAVETIKNFQQFCINYADHLTLQHALIQPVKPKDISF